MKTTRVLIPALTLVATALLVAQETPGQPPKREPAPPAPPAETPPAPAPKPEPTEAFPAPGDPAPPATPAPTPAPPATTPAPAPTPTPPAPTPTPPAPTPTPPATTPAPTPAPTPTPAAPAPAPAPAIQPLPPVANPAAVVVPEAKSDPAIGMGTITGTRVSARGRATIFSDLVFRFNQNEPVTILEEINLASPKAGEPRKWYRVQMPHDTGAWVHGDFLDKSFTKTINNVELTFAPVKASRLNVRGGPGENHPVLARLSQGASVKLSGQRKGKWVEVFAPANASVFVASQFVQIQSVAAAQVPAVNPGAGVEIPGSPAAAPATPGNDGGTTVTIPLESFGKPEAVSPEGVPIKRAETPGSATTPATPEVTKPATPEVAQPVVPPAEVVEVTPPSTPVTPATPEVTAPISPVVPEETVKPEEPIVPAQPAEPAQVTEVNPNLPPASTVKPGEGELPVRIVTREGVVRRTLHIQAPSGYVLEHVDTGKKINFLMLDHPTLKLNWFEGQRVLVSGEEAIDIRHVNTPVLKIQTLKGDLSKDAVEKITIARAEEAKEAVEKKAEEPKEQEEQPAPEKEETPSEEESPAPTEPSEDEDKPEAN